MKSRFLNSKFLQILTLLKNVCFFVVDCSGTPDSGPNSPPTRGSPTSANAPIQEENEDPHYNNGVNRASINDLQLFSSPSMPNISLGRPHLSNAAVAAANHYVSCKTHLPFIVVN